MTDQSTQKSLLARERIAKFLWDMAAEETGTRKWDEVAEDQHILKSRYLQAAAITVAVLSYVIGGPERFR
jgi:hypothetical protein